MSIQEGLNSSLLSVEYGNGKPEVVLEALSRSHIPGGNSRVDESWQRLGKGGLS